MSTGPPSLTLAQRASVLRAVSPSLSQMKNEVSRYRQLETSGSQESARKANALEAEIAVLEEAIRVLWLMC